MGSALFSAIAKNVTPGNLSVCDTSESKAHAFANVRGDAVKTAKQIAEECRFIFLGVKPQGLEGLLAELSPILVAREDDFVLVSMAAGVSIKAIEAYVNCSCSIIRIMPNTPVAVGQGVVLYSTNSRVTEDELTEFGEIMKAVGLLDPIPEEKIDAASALSGCGPAFVAMMAEALADGAVACGLPREKANLYAAQTLLGTAKLLLDYGKHPGQIKDAVCSPGGTTIAGVQVMEEKGARAALSAAVIAAYEKTLKLKQ